MPIEILIPTYQRVESLRQNLAHILGRMHAENVEDHYRIIVSDNASTDSTESMVRTLMERVN